MAEVMSAVEITFKVEPLAGLDGKQWITCELKGGDPVYIGYITPLGDAVAAHGTGDGWPQIDVCADDTRAVCAVIGAWGRQMATDPGDDDDNT
jgi:hypothetical protein